MPTPPDDHTPDPVAAGARVTAIVSAALLTIGAVLLTIVAFRVPQLELDEVVAEKHDALEWAAVGVWIAIVFASAWAALRQRTWRLALLASWFGVLGLLAALRELDLHVVLNPANIHLIGLDASQAVRFRLDWWTDSGTPLGLRAAWAVVFACVGALVVLPFALARYPWPARLRAREPFPWLIAVGFVLLAGSYALDDFAGRPLARLGVDVAIVEETGELIGPLIIAAGVILLGVRRGAARNAPAPAR